MRLCIITSTRADWGLLSPLARALEASEGVELQILATNMHLLPAYGMTVNEIIADGFHVDARVEMQFEDASATARVHAMSQCMAGCADAFAAVRPDMVVILGDRFEMLAVASAAAVMQIPIVHIAGGEISEGAIDDSIRHAITKLSALHFTATEPYRERVIAMGESPDRVFNTGALGVWNALHLPRLSHTELEQRIGMSFSPGSPILATYHPATLSPLDPAECCRQMLKALEATLHEHPIVLTYPNNDTGSEAIIRELQAFADAHPERVRLAQSLGRDGYLSMSAESAAVVGNSSSGIVEVPSLGIPVVDIGIRQRGRIASSVVIHCEDSASDILAAIQTATAPDFRKLASEIGCLNPYYKPDTVGLMTNIILSANPAELARKTFYDNV